MSLLGDRYAVAKDLQLIIGATLADVHWRLFGLIKGGNPLCLAPVVSHYGTILLCCP